MISVVCPTVSGREHYLELALESIRLTTPGYEFLVYKDLPSCGAAWNRGIKDASGSYILLFADDLVAHPDWWKMAAAVLEEGLLPCPRILKPDGTLESCGDYAEEAEEGTSSDVARVPFLTRELAQEIWPVFENQYMGDYWISWRCKHLGWETVVVRSMMFTHHAAMEGRIDSLSADVSAYKLATE